MICCLLYTSNDTVGIALPKAMRVSSVSVTGNNLESLKIQTSINGITWEDVESTIEDGTLKATVDATTTYVRVVNRCV